MREIRFSVSAEKQRSEAERNIWAGSPAVQGIAPYLTLRAVVIGPVNEQTGFLCNIRLLDKLLHDRAVPRLQEAFQDDTRRGSPAGEMPELWSAVEPHTPTPAGLEELIDKLIKTCKGRGRFWNFN